VYIINKVVSHIISPFPIDTIYLPSVERFSQALVYVSTAYSQFPLKEIEEKIYTPPHDPRGISDTVNWLSETDFQAFEPM